MGRIYLSITLVVISFSVACGQIPQTLSYQGLLTDASGVPVEGTSQVSFKFYTSLTGGTPLTGSTRGPIAVTTFKGLFTATLGDNSTNNAPLNFNLGDQEIFVELILGPNPDGTPLTPRIKITAVPYAFVANTVKGVDAAIINSGTLPVARIADNSITNAKLAAGIDASKLNGNVSINNGGTGASTVADARTALGLGSLATLSTVTTSQITDATIATADIADGAISNTKIATGLDAAKLTGTLPNAVLDADLVDLADGTLTGSKVDGSTLNTISATNITTGTLALGNGGTGATTAANARTNLGVVIGTNVQAYDADLDDLADGSLTGSKVGTGINATNITSGTLSLTGTDASKLATGTTAQRPGSPVEGQIRYNSTEKVMEYYNGANWYFMVPKVAFLKDLKNDGISGGSFTGGGTWTNVRTLNSETDPDGIVNLSSSTQFTLESGEYIIEASVPGFAIALNQARLTYGVTNIYGSNEYANPGTGSKSTSLIHARVSINAQTIFQIEHAGESNYGDGLGNVNNIVGPASSEVYTQVKITKLR